MPMTILIGGPRDGEVLVADDGAGPHLPEGYRAHSWLGEPGALSLDQAVDVTAVHVSVAPGDRSAAIEQALGEQLTFECSR